jgi:hypothetical protein
MNTVEDNANRVKGWLFIETQKHYLRGGTDPFDDTSVANAPWAKVTVLALM